MPRPSDDEKTPLSPSDYNTAASFRSISPDAPSIIAVATRSHDGKPRLVTQGRVSMSHARLPPSPSKLNHDDPKRSSFIRLIAAFRRRHPILSIILFLLSMAVLILMILLVLSVTHAFPRNIPYWTPNRTSTDDYKTTLPSSPVQLAYLSNFPDPALHYDNSSSTWYAYGTNPRAGTLPLPRKLINNTESLPSLLPSTHLDPDQSHNIQLLSSTDLLTWTIHPDPLQTLGSWVHHPTNASALQNPSTLYNTSTTQNTSASDGFANVWAPDVFLNPTAADAATSYIMYYAATSAQYPTLHCIGAASSPSAIGPFTSTPDALVCPESLGGAIDSAVFVDNIAGNNGNARGPAVAADTSTQPIYLLYKIDGNAKGHGGSCGNGVAPQVDTPIQLLRLDESGLAVAPGAEAVTILDRTAEDGPLIEAPSLIKVGGTYTLFYSSGCTRENSYTVKYATATEIAGPYTRRGTLLKTGDLGLVAPGSVTVRVQSPAQGSGSLSGANIGTKEDSWIMAFAARTNTRSGGVRAMYTVGLRFADDGTVQVVQGASM